MHQNTVTQRALWLGLFAAVSLAACGGGGGGGGGKSNGQQSGFRPGEFKDAATFAARCEVPRSGTNPQTNAPYPDVRGSTTDENNFLRSWSNNTYLWYDEIVDRDPALYSDPLAYFDLLKTTALSPSGQPKDKFHFTYDTDAYFQLSQSGVSAGYGAQWYLEQNGNDRTVLIAYTEPDAPATNLPTPLVRGTEILEVDGVSVDTTTQAGVATLNAGLFPDSAGESHTFLVRDRDTQGTRTVTMTSATFTTQPVSDWQVLETLSGDVGYLLFNDHLATAEQALIDAIDGLNSHDGGSGIDDLVLDLRYNGGGYLAIASELAYMVAGAGPTAGRAFEELQFNDKHPVTDPVTGRPLSPTPFYTRTLGPPFNGEPGRDLPTLNLSRVFVIAGPGTCSASEAIMNGLRGVGVEVHQIGDTTCGKPYGFYPTDNCGTTYFTIQFRGVNAVGFGDYSDGFTPSNSQTGNDEALLPGCAAEDDFGKDLGDPAEGSLAMALAYRESGSCSLPVRLKARSSTDPTGQGEIEVLVPKSPLLKNRVLWP